MAPFDDVIVGVDVEDGAAERAMLRRERRLADADVAGRRRRRHRLPAVARPAVGLVEQLELVEPGLRAKDTLALRLGPHGRLMRCRKVRR